MLLPVSRPLGPVARRLGPLSQPLSNISGELDRAESIARLERDVQDISPTTAGAIFRLWDTPGRTVRSGLSALLGDYDPEISGIELNKLAGIDFDNGWIDKPLGFATEVITDPLTWMTGGVGAAGKIGRAAKAAGLIDRSGKVFSRAAINAGKAGQLAKRGRLPFLRGTGSNAADTFRQAGKLDDLNDWSRVVDDDLAVRPLVGPRQALRDTLPGTNRSMRLRDLVDDAVDPAVAKEDLSNFLRTTNVDSYLDKPLFKDIGFRIPGTPIDFGMNIPFVGKPLSRGLDTALDGLRWTSLGMKVAQKTDPSLLDQADPVGQLIAKRFTNAEKAADLTSTGKMFDAVFAEAPDDFIELIKNPQNGKLFRALVEGNDSYLKTLSSFDATDPSVQAMLSHSALPKVLENAKTYFKDYLDESAKAGVRGSALADEFGNGYFPRKLAPELFPEGQRGGRDYLRNVTGYTRLSKGSGDVITSDMMSRQPEFNIPGGTAMLNDLGRIAPGLSEDKLADEIMNRVAKAESVLKVGSQGWKGVPFPVKEYSRQNAVKLASTLKKLDLSDGKELFGQNPIEMMANYGKNRQRAINRAEQLQSLLTETSSIPTVAGGRGGMSLPEAIRDLGMDAVRSQPNVMKKVDDLFGAGIIKSADEIPNISADVELMNRIGNIADFYAQPEMKAGFFKTLKEFTDNFKLWVLATPRRFARDWYSGLFSNFVTHPHPADLHHGYTMTKAIMQQDWDAVARLAKNIPRYSKFAGDPEQLIRAVRRDMALVNMSQTGRLREIDESGKMLGESDIFPQYMGGAGRAVTTPGYAAWDTITGNFDAPSIFSDKFSGSELFTRKNWGDRIVSEPIPRMFGLSKGTKEFGEASVKNPVLRAAARSAETTDTINRLGGYFAMMKGGHSAESAAKSITRAQVDYGSLTPFERKYLTALFPFWAYQSRIAKWGVEEMFSNPTYYQTALRAPQALFGTGEEYTPSRIQERYGFKIPEGLENVLGPLLGEPVPGVENYLSDIDLPFVDTLNTADFVMDSPSGDDQLFNVDLSQSLTESMRNVAGSMLNPLAKQGIEQISGVDLYTKSELDPTRRTMPTLARRAGLAEDAATQESIGFIEPTITSAVPALNPLLSVLRRATSEKVPDRRAAALQALLNFTTGVKVEQVAPEERLSDMRRKINMLLGADPHAREMGITYVPKSQQPYVSPETLQLMELNKIIGERQRAARDARVNPLLQNQ